MVATGAGLVSLAGCAGAGSSLVLPKSGSNVTNLANFTRKASYKARGVVSARNTSVIQQICAGDTCGSGDGGGDIYTDPTAYHVRAVASDGSSSLANYDASAAAQLNISSSSGSPALTTTATQANPTADYGVQQVTTYSNGSQLTRTVSDVNNGSGTFVDPQGNVWTISIYVDSSTITVNYSGPQTGSITVSIGDFTYSSGTRQMAGCSATTKKGAHSVGLAFDAAGLLLVGLGLGAPFGVVAGLIGLGIGLYSYYC